MIDLGEQAASLFGVQLTDEQRAALDVITEDLLTWNAHTNLTAITEPEQIQVRHFLDSLSVARLAPLTDGTRIIDVGTGAGFPGLVLAVAFPGVQVTLMDGTAKKLAFIDHVNARLNLRNASTLHARAEEAGQDNDHRARYDVVLARAVARMPVLLEYTLPLARVGGQVIAMKGSALDEEVADSGAALKTLGGRLERTETVYLPGQDYPHYLVSVRKDSATPSAYPRRPGVPSKRPIE